MFPIRQVVQDYGRSCERLLSPYSFDSPLSEEEVQFIHYYLNEVTKRLESVVYQLQVNRAAQMNRNRFNSFVTRP
jgi:hypothetical protein